MKDFLVDGLTQTRSAKEGKKGKSEVKAKERKWGMNELFVITSNYNNTNK